MHHATFPAAEESACTVCGLSQDLSYGRNVVRIVAESAAMQSVLRRVARIAPTDASILITGESGTGKEVVARAVHDASERRQSRFVAINCAALPADLLESELFGHSRGAFTGASGARRGLFEEANGGTLFLDEIGELPPGLQPKLLRALQEGEIRRVGENEQVLVDVRVIAATNSDLPQLVAEKRFREDLYYRLKVFSLQLPPLRERRADVLPMARAFLAAERPAAALSPEAERALVAWSWPGNVRELRNAVRHGAVLAEGGTIDAADLPPELLSGEGREHGAGPHERAERTAAMPASSRAAPAASAAPAAPLDAEAQSDAAPPQAAGGTSAPAPGHHLAEFSTTAPLEDVVRAHVLAAVEAFDGNRAAAARALGVGRNTLWRWLKGGRGACNRHGE